MHFKSIQYTGRTAGTRIIITGAVHGNETCGTKAITRVIDDIESGRINIIAGHVTFVPITNPLAYAKGERSGDRNLNRNLYPVDEPKDFEDHIANWLCPLMAEHDCLLDLHSTRAKNPAFAMLGPADNDGDLQPFHHYAQERAMAAHLGVNRFVDGWLATYALGVARRQANAKATGVDPNPLNTDPRYGVGTTEFMRSTGGYSITLECGQHEADESPEVGYQAICNTLAFLGISDGPKPAPVKEIEQLHMYEVIDKNHPDDTFTREWASFNKLNKGDTIANRHDGAPIIAETDGYILFPDAKAAAGGEWFYLARA
jgi:predicted deacylase